MGRFAKGQRTEPGDGGGGHQTVVIPRNADAEWGVVLFGLAAVGTMWLAFQAGQLPVSGYLLAPATLVLVGWMFAIKIRRRPLIEVYPDRVCVTGHWRATTCFGPKEISVRKPRPYDTEGIMTDPMVEVRCGSRNVVIFRPPDGMTLDDVYDLLWPFDRYYVADAKPGDDDPTSTRI